VTRSGPRGPREHKQIARRASEAVGEMSAEAAYRPLTRRLCERRPTKRNVLAGITHANYSGIPDLRSPSLRRARSCWYVGLVSARGTGERVRNVDTLVPGRLSK